MRSAASSRHHRIPRYPSLCGGRNGLRDFDKQGADQSLHPESSPGSPWQCPRGSDPSVKTRYHVRGVTKWDKDLHDWVPDPDATQLIPKEIQNWLSGHLFHEALDLILEYYDMEEVHPIPINTHAIYVRHKKTNIP